ncbi:MAG: T9SS type A sorting domain-containing protein [Bacteroidia bacterium]|nr:T9SS type A sorting domain-containing protein [Bacteroidia bacterium]
MRKIITSFCLLVGILLNAQVTRTVLYEEFTGENCPPCAATNPWLDNFLLSAPNNTKVILIKWQVPIPSAPSNTWSLYQTNKAEINWRYQASGYGYQSQNTPTSSITNGINSAPQGRIDGQHQWLFGAASNHPGNLTSAAINSAQAQPTPFSITLTPNWDPTYTQATVNVAINAQSAFTASGNLVFRLCLVEREINFATPPGSNGEKTFHDVVRKSYPTTTSGTVVTGMGTSIPNNFTAGQTHTFSVVCPIPNYITDLSQMAFVGFIQDDGNKKVWQAARTPQPSIPNDIKFNSVIMNNVICGTTINPTINVKNNGTNPITSLTITPYVNGIAQTPYVANVNIAGGSTANVSLGTYNLTGGPTHVFSVNITGVSGGDINTANNKGSFSFVNVTSYLPGPVTESFTTSSPFPPTNWFRTNPDGGTFTWGWHSAGLNGAGSAKYDFFNNAVIGDVDELYLPPSNFSSQSNIVLTFDYAYTYYTAPPNNENDKLEVMISTNCGNSWTVVDMMSGTSMTTAPNSTSAFTPSSPNQWKSRLISLPAAANNPSVLVKFVATADYGNNLYIDNVNLQSITALKKYDLNQLVHLFPNPTRDASNLTIHAKESGNLTVNVINMIGQEVFRTSKNINEGFNQISIPSSQWESGVYLINITLNGEHTVKKLNVTK